MKAMLVTAFSLPETVGGTQVMLGAVSRSLIAQGHEVTVFRSGISNGVPIYEVARDSFEGADLVSVGNDFSDLDSFQKLYRNEKIDRVFEEEVRRLQPDVVHVHLLTCLSTGMLDVLRELRIPTVLSLWDFWLGCPRGQRMQDDLTLCHEVEPAKCASCCSRLWPHLFPGDADNVAMMREYGAWIRRQLDEVDVLAVPSEDTREHYRAFGLQRDQIDVVACGLQKERFDVPRAAPQGRLRIGYIGSVIPSKGAHILVEAVQQLDPGLVQLDVHGEAFAWHNDTTYAERLQELDAGTHLITMHGRYEHAEVPTIMANIDVLVVPGLWFETYCITIREGFLGNAAVIASDLGAMAEGVEHEVTGLLVEPGSVAALTAALQRMLDEPDLRDRLVNAPKAVHDTAAMVAKFSGLYDAARARRGLAVGFA